MKTIIRIALIILLITNYQSLITLNAQVAINADGTLPDASAMLDVSSADKGILIPRMDSTSRNNISNPAIGLMVFDSTTNSFWYYANSSWNNINTILSDVDGDTKIQVEESNDEDIIRFDMNGTEFFRLDSGQIEVLNTGYSLFLGFEAGENDDRSDNRNVFIGQYSGYNNTSGEKNTFIGNSTGYKNSGNRNTFVGILAGYSNAANYNVFVGAYSGFNNSSGYGNTFMGEGAGYNNSTGYQNLFVGYQTGLNNTTGYRNTYLGQEAGRQATGYKNIFLGYQAGYNETGNNKLYIENSSADNSNALIYGEFDNDYLQINGNLVVTEGLTDMDNDTKIQVEESSDEDIIRFDLDGVEYMRLDSGRIEILNTEGTIVIGEEAGENDIYSGNNVYIGYQSGQSNISGSSNTFIGYQTGQSNTGTANTFIGKQAGKNNTSGEYNSALGRGAGLANTTGSDNVYLGSYAGFINTTGGQNVYLGTSTGGSNQTGSYNIFIGYQAGYNETNSNKLYIENSSSASPLIYGEFDNDYLQVNGNLSITGGYTDSDGDTKIQVEESSDEDIIRFDLGGTEFLRLDSGRIKVANTGYSIFLGSNTGINDDFTDNANVFIGNSSGRYNTSGYHNVGLGNHANQDNTTGYGNVALGYGAGFTNAGSENIFLGYRAGYNEAGSNKLYIENSNATSPLIYGEFDNDRVVINGNDTDNSNNRTLFVNGSIGATSAFNNDSDRRLKTDIQTIPNALNKVLEMRGVTYQWKDGRETGDRMGFIAQEVEPILPEVVDNKNDHYTMQYAPITAVLIEAVKEQQSQIEELKSENEQLKIQLKKINQLEAKLEAKLEALSNSLN